MRGAWAKNPRPFSYADKAEFQTTIIEVPIAVVSICFRRFVVLETKPYTLCIETPGAIQNRYEGRRAYPPPEH